MTSILERHRERFQTTPGDTQAFESLEEHLFLAGDWDAVIALYEHRMTAAAVTAVPSELSQVRFRMAQVIHDQLGDENRAIACYSEVLRDDPRHRPALMQLRRIHTRAGRWDVAVQLAEMECELPMGPEERAGLLCDMGCIWLDQLDDPQQALAQFERALEEHPEQRGALEGAARALERCDRHRDAAANWERLAAQLKGEARAEANVALAKIVANDLREVDRARGLYRDALGDNPNNLEAIRAVAEEAEKRQQWRLLADLRERQYELLDDAGERVSLAVELAELHRGPLDNRQAAHMWFSRAAELGSESPDVYEALADHEREHGYDDALLQCLERALALRGETAPASLVLEVATLYADRGDDEHALAGLQRAAELSPEDALVVDALSETLSRLGRDEELVDVLERRAGLVTGDASAHAAALADLAQLHEERLGDPDAACQAYQRAFAVDPSAPEIAAALERSLRKREDWDGLRDFLSAAGAEGPQCERVGYLCALAALERDHCGDIDAAKRAFEAALLLDPVMAAAHRGLQDLAAEAHDEQGVLRALQREADVTDDRSRLATLAPEIASRLEGQDRPEEALAWVERWVTACPDDPDALIRCAELQERLGETGLAATLEKLDGMLPGDARAANRRRLAAAHTACGRIEDAIASYRRALEADPADTEALEAIAVHLESEHRLVELAEMRRRLAELLPPEKRAACLDDLARLFSERLGDVGGAIAALQQLVATEHPPSDAHERLEALLERGARYEELVPYLAERTQALPADSPERTAAELKRADVLLNHLGRFDEAVAGFRAVCDRLPENRPAREGLSRALRAAGDPQPLADFLADEMENASEPKTREWCAFERAVLLEESLGRADEANAGYRRLLDRAVGADVRHAAAEKLEILLERTESGGELRDHIAALRSESDGARAAALDERLGRLCRDRLGDRANAITHLRAAADAAPERADLWRDLGELYAAAGSPADAVDAVEAELACAPDRERELALRARAAASCARDLRDPERARVHYERLLELEPSHAEASEFLIDYCQRNDEFASVARLLEARLAGLDGAPREDHGPWAAQRASLRVRIAGLRASQLDDLDGAIAILEPALGEIGPRAIVAEPLADLYQRAGYSEDLIELCRGAAARCQEAAERANWNVRQGDALQRCGRDEEAAESYRLALTDRPEDREVQAALRDLYRRSGEEEALTRLLEVELSHLAGAEEIPARLELAGLLSGAQNRSAEALTHVRRVLQIEPGHSDALEQALALAEALSLTDVVIALFDGALEVTHPPMARAALLSRRAQVLAGLPGRRDDAVIGYREALTLDPARSADRTALRSLLTTQGDWQGVLDCLHQEATGGDDASRARLFEMGAEIAWQRVSPDAALPWLERLRSVRPGDPDVLTRVCEVHRLADHPEALLHALETAIETLPDTRALRLEAADLLENRLGAPARAVAALEGARRESPQDVEILRRLARLYASLDRHRERAAVLEVLIARSAGESRLALLRDIADLYAGPLGDPQRAAEHLLDAVSAARGKSVCVELLRTLGDALRAAKRTEAWARCAEQELRTLDPDAPVLSDRRRLLRRELAVAYEEELGRPDAALRHLRALLALKWSEAHGAGGDELDAIENAALRLLRCEGSWIELCDRLETHLERRPDDPDRWLELARLREERLRSPAAARDAYEATLDRRPDDIDAIRGLRRCAELLGDWEGVRRILQRELDVAEDLSARERSALLRRLGDVSWHRLESTTLASRSYASALEASPQDFASLRSLQRLLEAMEDW
ncbi:MAG: tetratricopeptide repeat protein, partial [Myxococcota bacterium]